MAVYLLHASGTIGSENKYGKAQHYIGWARISVEKRLAEHVNGQGASITAAFVAQGHTLEVARAWPDGDRSLERRLKNRKNAKLLCPICSGEHALERGKE